VFILIHLALRATHLKTVIPESGVTERAIPGRIETLAKNPIRRDRVPRNARWVAVSREALRQLRGLADPKLRMGERSGSRPD
jgi:hypothetical protein